MDNPWDPKQSLERIYPPKSILSRLKSTIQSYNLIDIKPKNRRKLFKSKAALRHEAEKHIASGYWYILHPMSKVRLYWEILMVIVFYISLFVLPFGIFLHENAISYENICNTSSYYLIELNVTIDLLFIFDMILSFFTAYIDVKLQKTVFEPLEIAKYFLAGRFLVDFIPSLPVNCFFAILRKCYICSLFRKFMAIIMLISYLRIFRMQTDAVYRNNISEAYGINLKGNFLKLTKMVMLSLLIYHWATCLAYFVSINTSLYLNDFVRPSWINRMNISQPSYSLDEKYITTLYVTIGQIINTDFGIDFTRTVDDAFMSTILFIVGKIYCTFLCVFVIVHVKESTSSKVKYEEIMSQLKVYMLQKKYPQIIQKRIIEFYDYKFHKNYFNEKPIMDTLSERLREEVKLCSCRKLIENCHIFHDLPKPFIVSIIKKLVFEVFLPNDILIKAGTTGDYMFFLARGTVAVYTRNGKEVCHLEDGSYFGEIALLLPDNRRIATVITIDVCEMYRLDRRSFHKCFAAHKQLYDDFERMAVSRIEDTLKNEELQRQYLLVKAKRTSTL